MKLLPGQDLTGSDYAQLRARVDAILWELIYAPIIAVVRPALPPVLRPELAPKAMRAATPEELRNAGEADGLAALLRALERGAAQMVPAPKDPTRVAFVVVKPDRLVTDGLRSFGAQLNKTTGAWTCARTAVPPAIAAAAAGFQLRSQATHDAVKKTLRDLEARLDQAIAESSLQKAADHAIGEVAQGWKESAKKLEVVPDLGLAGRDALAAAFAEKTKIPIKNWAQEAITRLREEVDANAAAGFRAEGLAERIRTEYGVSKARADLIARQETSNYMAGYRQARALDAGLRRYVWRTTNDLRARPGHKEINGRIFTYRDKAPAIYMSSGVPCNPLEDFRCRCRDLAVIE